MTDKTPEFHFDTELENLIVDAAEHILKIVADPNNPEVYGKPSIDYQGILSRVLEEEPRFTDYPVCVGEGVTRLLNAGKIECRTGEITVYRLPEEK